MNGIPVCEGPARVRPVEWSEQHRAAVFSSYEFGVHWIDILECLRKAAETDGYVVRARFATSVALTIVDSISVNKKLNNPSLCSRLRVCDTV